MVVPTIISAFGKLRQEDNQFKDSLAYQRPCLKGEKKDITEIKFKKRKMANETE